MIDLHSHTDHSDGSCSPAELVRLAAEAGLEALAITDHDTLSGYDEACLAPPPASLELIRGIEITCRYERGSIHLLGYFLHADPGEHFRAWLSETHRHRRERNLRLIGRLRELGLQVAIEEVDALGRTMTGRPHFARVLVSKGYAASVEDAFQRYLGEGSAGYVERHGPGLRETIERIAAAGGVSSLAHPVRIDVDDEEAFLAQMAAAGLDAIEAFHSLHSEADSARYLELARRYSLAVTGGSDFHGSLHGGLRLGCPSLDRHWLDALRLRR
ncbi:MAG: PHP domain-containing protein [Bryobacteraceae bacterium]|nr:PHP domain-containing protein [Bryobacteraceae bacterium]